MKVLLSIKPKYADKIFKGEKRYEYRRVIFKRKDITTVVVYVTAPVSKIVGEFKINEILFDDISSLWQKTKEFGGISEELFHNYFENKEKGYAIHVGETEVYEDPISLRDEYDLNPPQSFAYI
ncbi:MAG: ASCH domain-containing protein [Thermoplasmata archaeon]|nr:MAG: ASCH domain-containing protein [Thermoplasmata archaeon]